LTLARERLARYGKRMHLIRGDLTREGWLAAVPGQADAAVSSTALHWLPARDLALLYTRLYSVLRPGGIFVNADHVGSESPLIQESWERHREEMRTGEGHATADDWEGFWRAYLAELGPEAAEARQRLIGEWRGTDQGLPLAWHMDQLRSAGFVAVDCYWRCDCDAVYGGIRA
jgi:SAM-dependent methyltransferase